MERGSKGSQRGSQWLSRMKMIFHCLREAKKAVRKTGLALEHSSVLEMEMGHNRFLHSVLRGQAPKS